MKIKLPVVFLLMFGFLTCSKDTYNTSPTLKFESVNGTVFPQNTIVSFTLQCTDKEGDVVDTIWVQRVSKVKPCQYLDSPMAYRIPNFQPPKNVKADFNFTYGYPTSPSGGATLSGCTDLNASLSDTCYFRFWMHDNARHVSDTAQSPEIVLLQQ